MLENEPSQKILISVISYILGFVTCFVFKRNVEGDPKRNFQIKDNTFVLGVVTVIWAFSVFVDIMSPQYETSPFIHGLMGAIVGFFYKPGGGKKSCTSK